MITLNLLVVLNILILFCLLFFRKNNSLPNKILAVIFLIPGLNFANNVNILTGSIYTFPYAYFIVQGTSLLFAPAVYYYILLLIGKKNTHHKILLLISGLLLCFDLYLLVDFFLLDAVAQQHYITSLLKPESYPAEMALFSSLLFLHQLVYFTLGIREVYRYKKNTKDVFSDTKATKFAYLQRFILLLWALTALTILMYATIDTIYVEYIFLPLVILTIYFFILYYAFHNNAIFTYESFNVTLDLQVNTQIQGLVKNMEEEKQLFAEELPEKIKELIHDTQIYKDPDISVYKLAAELNAPPYQISKAINQGLMTNFYDLINQNRVEEAKTLLASMQESNLSIEGIAFEVGFNSRTAFYRAFKKYTGKNPSDFKDQ